MPRASRNKVSLEDVNLMTYEPIYVQPKVSNDYPSHDLIKEEVETIKTYQPRLITENGVEKWVLEIQPDYFSIDEQPKFIQEEVKPVNKLSIFFSWLKSKDQWKWIFIGLTFWTINHYSATYLTWINNNVNSLSWWVVKEIKTALEFQVKGISVFNWVFYILTGIPFIKLVSRMLVKLPQYLVNEIEKNKVWHRNEVLKRDKEIQANIRKERGMLLEQIKEDQEFLRHCRVIVHNQTI